MTVSSPPRLLTPAILLFASALFLVVAILIWLAASDAVIAKYVFLCSMPSGNDPVSLKNLIDSP